MWIQDQAIAFECACDAIAHMIAIYSASLCVEKKKPEPDLSYIVEIRNKIDELARERRLLHVTDHEKIAMIRRDYGAQIRARNASERNGDGP